MNRAFAVWMRLQIAVVTFAAPAMSSMPCPAAEAAAEEVEVDPALIREIQFMLLRLGMDPGPIDGIVGPKTTKAFLTFVERSGMPVQPLVNGGRIPGTMLARLRTEASRVILGGEAKRGAATAPAAATQPAAPVPGRGNGSRRAVHRRWRDPCPRTPRRRSRAT